MRIGLIDVDGHNYLNLALMKLSAWHKSQGDTVEWYEPFKGHYDRVYMSKVFSFTPDYEYPIYADEIIEGGAATPYLSKTVSRCTTKAKTTICRTRSSIHIPITNCTESQTRLTDI